MNHDIEREFIAQKQKIRQIEARNQELEKTVNYLRYALSNQQKLCYETNSTNALGVKILKEVIDMLHNKTNADPMGIYVKSYHLLNRN